METSVAKDALTRDIRRVLRGGRGKQHESLSALESLHSVQARWQMAGVAEPQRHEISYDTLIELLARLEKDDSLLAAVLKAQFVSGDTGRAVAQQLDRSLDQINRLQKKGLQRLVAYLQEMEEAWLHKQHDQQRTRIPSASYRTLFGLKQQQETIVAKLNDQDNFSQLAVVGIGGIGKSSLIHKAVMVTLAQEAFVEVFWVQVANQFPAPISTLAHALDQLSQQLPQLQGESPNEQLAMLHRLMAEKRCLLVLDNLERQADLNHILRQFQGWTGPSAILYGSRVRPQIELGVSTLELNELAPTEAKALFHDHLQAITPPEQFQPLAPVDLAQIYELVGGNPLALKMVAGLLRVMPLANILRAIRAGHSGPPADLYQRIFAQAWLSLSESARQLILVMPLVDETGGTPEHLQAVAELDEALFWQAVQELSQRCLIEIRGNIHEKRYGIHRLTAVFLENVMDSWSDEHDDFSI